jgi:hypothetical protein
MTLKQFIQANRAELDSAINRALNHVPKQASCYCHLSGTDHDHSDAPKRNDEDRRQWVLNDQGLYNWARSEGVRI